MQDRVNVVTLGGGSGQSTLLVALGRLPYARVTAIVTPFDSGGSSRKLRDQYDVLPYGDIQRCIFALSPYEHVRDIFSRRLDLPEVQAPYHTGGNLLLSALEQDFRRTMPVPDARRLAIRALEQMFQVRGHVYPAALRYTDLCARFEDGALATHEQEVDEYIQAGHRPECVRLAESVPANEDALRAIVQADILTISPGSWYTSIIPSMLPEGIREALQESRAPIVWVVNLLTEGVEMAAWTGATFVHELMQLTSRAPAALLVNSTVLELPGSYRGERKTPLSQKLFRSYVPAVVRYPLWLDAETPRHDPDQLACALGLLLPTLLP